MLRLVCLVVLSVVFAVPTFAADAPRFRQPVGRVLYYFGKLQHVHVGYSPNLRADLTKKIEALLKPDEHP